MRIRRKKWAEKELAEAEFYINNPEIGYKNTWKTRFEKVQPIHIEIGCGKGLFISKLARENEDINYIAIDMIEAMLGCSKRNIEEEYGVEKKPSNLLLIRANAERILDVFGDEDKIDRIYINFCNPWPKAKHNKRRLTHPRQLESYKHFLSEGAKIYFKTDDDELFDVSREYFDECNFSEEKITFDLNKEPIFGKNIMTEHEMMFMSDGKKIKAGIFKLED